MSFVSLNIGGDFTKLIEKWVFQPLWHYLILALGKSKLWIVISIKFIFSCIWKSYSHIFEFINEWRCPGQREKANKSLRELAKQFNGCILLIELSNGRYWWEKLYTRKHNNPIFQKWLLCLDYYNLVTIPNGIVKDTKLTRLGYRVAYMIQCHGEIPPIWYPIPMFP